MRQILFIFILIAMAITADAQRDHLFAVDTLTDADTITLEIPYQLNGDYDYFIEVHADSLSGATAATATLQETTTRSGDDWVDRTAVTIDGVSTDSIVTGQAYGLRQRIQIISSGTQSTRLEISARHTRRK